MLVTPFFPLALPQVAAPVLGQKIPVTEWERSLAQPQEPKLKPGRHANGHAPRTKLFPVGRRLAVLRPKIPAWVWELAPTVV